ncbi:LAMI_0F03026g1_1 [Lachancea mirantina]|uniref:LAMI_0F03026g1_1 n=1 Tax=Lachancea mirantina TaxID=1230905 RepID=A0A1G4JX19_9SACH|nr:LAMI_0F03026g1_1 [Lachancea mirantina]
MNEAEGSKKPLRSCVRCRRNKTKCDSYVTRPGPCTSCLKRGVECILDYVAPPQRSKEIKDLYDSVAEVKEGLGHLLSSYESLLEGCGNRNLEAVSKVLHVKVMKFGNGELIMIKLDDEFLMINNVKVSVIKANSAFLEFQTVIRELLRIYELSDAEFLGFKLEDMDDDFSEEYDVVNLFRTDRLLMLLLVVNFYFDVPGLRYLDIYEAVLEDFCQLSLGEEEVGDVFSRRRLTKYICGSRREMSNEFSSEMFTKRMTLYLFYHIVLYGPVLFLDSFIFRYIKTLESVRKKIDLDRNWEIRWVNFYVKIFDLLQSGYMKHPFVDDSCELYRLMKFDIDYLDRGVNANAEGIREIMNASYSLLIDDNREENQWRKSFVSMFLSQLVSLNVLICCNMDSCGEEMRRALRDSVRFNGFSFKIVERTPKVLFDYDIGSYYGVQWKRDILEEFAVMGLAEHEAGCHEIDVQLLSLEDFVLKHLVSDYDNELINRSCCGFIWKLFEACMYREIMGRIGLRKVVTFVPRNCLEVCGMLVGYDDSRAEEVSSIIRGVDWSKESAEDVVMKLRRAI